MSYEKTVKVYFHGYLKDICPEPIEACGFSVSEVLKGIGNQIEELRPKLGEGRHQVTVKGYNSEAELKGPIDPAHDEIHVYPSLAGGKGGIFKVIIGVALIATAIYLGPAFTAFGGFLTSQGIMSFGISLLLGGLLDFLSPAPKIDRTGNAESDPEASKYLGATGNTVKIGTRRPLAYGENLLYGHYISFNVDAKDVAV